MTFLVLTGYWAIGQKVVILDHSVKGKIVNHFQTFEGEVSQETIDNLILNLEAMSTDSAEMCFNSLGIYNNCEDTPESLYPILERYLDDLIGKEVRVEFFSWNQPWLDEDYYSLSFKLIYQNDNINYPVEENFDTIILGVNKGEIKNFIYARELIDLANFGD